MADTVDSSYTRVKIIRQDRIEEECLEVVLFFVADSSNSKHRLSEETRKGGIAFRVS